ncbi:MAG: Rne/Rng family ribonuclease [Alphaproteobacteria bacterium]|nr:Rne/Rng family ribonuclease [Alphaproteobacteria bacterium]MBU1560926.1 Rne/Rng family ribonuclease [Alphaproteobacteria bacterium]MBU2304900.1 Rne/Rng family ribonuclease [Alphaproteobacteria bacterium]MBU2370151.1 Rne/Rng family ribonuclease [Alphaproteobacteria bacterium]
MATKRMLVDAIHPEETRIVVTSGNRLDEFDFESATRRQLRGNIYLAKVTRVEPSLQAAFVEYGGNRHGFLAFSEIHPDYYQIPVADREALLRDEEAEDDHHDEADENISLPEGVTEPDAEADPQDIEDASHIEQAPANSEPIESIGGADALEEVPERRRQSPNRRHYKIQEVIKRRQVMLVQVVKEERGNKGAALTTYLSLAGRYSVLMPNTARGGGISRKITNAADRKRLKEITSDLEVPQGMGVILRTAGAARTKAEVKRDFEYLMRLWESVRELTLKSQAPCLVYEEGSLIKRTIRDLYNKDIDEVFVAGEDAYREAKDFMRMIMPSHAKNVQLYKEDQPLFSKYGIEAQLDSMFSPTVTLPSGGYIVINPTEALVSIDVNSGRSTKEHNIEDTALQTNLEAADEVARQLRLRDLAGLIVIDFIDMMENRSNRAVERKLKDCLKDDRARIQVGRISHFGLMEMSRQRIRFGVVESSTHKCPICDGTGLVRSVESLALMIMRHIEDHVLRRQGQSINVRVPVEVALYILNFKRETLISLEIRNQLSITITADGKMTGHQFAIEKGEARVMAYADTRVTEHVRVDSAIIEDDADEEIVDEVEDEEAGESPAAAAASGENGEGEGRRRRRRRRRGGADREDNGQRPPQQRAAQAPSVEADAGEDSDEGDEEPNVARPSNDAGSDEEPRKRRRRGRRGGRRNRRDGEDGPEKAPSPAGEDGLTTAETETVAESLLAQDEIAAAETAVAEPAPVEKPKRTRRKKVEETAESAPVDAAPVEATPAEAEAPVEAEKPKRKPRARKPKAETAEAAPVASVAEVAKAPEAAKVEAAEAAAEAPKPRRAKKELPAEGIVVSSSAPKAEAEGEQAEPKKKAGWWQRRLGLG